MNTINFMNNSTNFTGIRHKNKRTENKNNNSSSNKMTMLPAIVLSSAILTNITPANISNNKNNFYYMNNDNTEVFNLDKLDKKNITSTRDFINPEDGTVYIIPYLPQVKIAKVDPRAQMKFLAADDL